MMRPTLGACRRLSSASKGLLASIDQGTSSSRVILYDQSLTPVASHQVPLETITPHAGWTQMDPKAILSSVEQCAAGALEKAGASAKDLLGVGITNQRESTVVWDKRTGEPLYDAILWHDGRTRDTVQALVAELGGQDALRSVTGLPISTYFSGSKLRWLMDNVPAVKAGIDGGTALFGTIDTWLVWNLTGGASGVGNGTTRHVTDVTNASRTLMMDLAATEWHAPTLQALGVGAALGALPQITSNAELLGRVADGGALTGAPLTGCIGDQQSAMVGQRCFSPGQTKVTYGTGCFMLMHASEGAPTPSSHGLLSTALYQMGPAAPPCYALEGAVASCATGINWFRDNLGMIDSAPQISQLAASVPDEAGGSEGLLFVPAFSGLLAPHWRDDARGTLVGLTLRHTKAHVARAVLEGIAYQAAEVAEAMVADAAPTTRLAALRVDGGVSMSDPLMQYQADLLGVAVDRPADVETTAAGAAIVAGIGAGVWESPADLGASAAVERSFAPAIGDDERAARKARWAKAVQCSLDWA